MAENCTEITPACPIELTLYGYYPNLPANATFCAGFAILLTAQVVSVACLRVRTWSYMILLAVGTVLEVAGYLGRIIMNKNPWSKGGLSIQLVCLIVGPSFIAAAVSVTFKQIVIYCGAKHSLIRPRWIPAVMVGTDFLCIVVQFIGAGILTKAVNGDKDQSVMDLGNAVIVAGVAIQVVNMLVCGGLMGIFMRRVRRAHVGSGSYESIQLSGVAQYDKDRLQGGTAGVGFRRFCWAMAAGFVAILIRCVYRLIEMASGWKSEIMQDEPSFLVLEAGMILVAVAVLVVYQPGLHFQPFLRKSK